MSGFSKQNLGTIRGYTPATRRVEASLIFPIRTHQRIEIIHPPSGWQQSIAAIWHRGRLVKQAVAGDVVEFEVLRPVAAGHEIFAFPLHPVPPPPPGTPGKSKMVGTSKRSRGGG